MAVANSIIDINVPLARRKALIAKLMAQLTRYQQQQGIGSVGSTSRAGQGSQSALRASPVMGGGGGRNFAMAGEGGGTAEPLPPADLSNIQSGFVGSGGYPGEIDYGDPNSGDQGDQGDYPADPPDPFPNAGDVGYVPPGDPNAPPRWEGEPVPGSMPGPGGNLPDDPWFHNTQAQQDFMSLDPGMQQDVVRNPFLRRTYMAI